MKGDDFLAVMNKASHYEKVMLKGLWANGDLTRDMHKLMQGEEIRLYVPVKLQFVETSATEAESTMIDIAQFKARRVSGARYEVLASMRPWRHDSWIIVGRIN